MATALISNLSIRALHAAACGLILTATGCMTETDASGDGFVGSARVTLAEVPAGIQCIKLLAERASDRIERSFPVSPEADAVLELNGLPTGDVVFSGAAYTQHCQLVTETSAAAWLAEPVLSGIAPEPSSAANLRMVMKPAIRSSVDFFAQAPRNGSDPTRNRGRTVSIAIRDNNPN